jgi:hypothetical protein
LLFRPTLFNVALVSQQIDFDGVSVRLGIAQMAIAWTGVVQLGTVERRLA